MSNLDQGDDPFDADLGRWLGPYDGPSADEEDGSIVDGLTAVLAVCAVLRERRLAAGLDVSDVAARCACDGEAIAWVDEGDVAAPIEAVVYYAAALGLSLRLVLQ